MDHVYVSVGDVLLVHEEALRHGGGTAGVRDRAALESAVFRPQCGYYTDVVEEAAALMESLTMKPSLCGCQQTHGIFGDGPLSESQ